MTDLVYSIPTWLVAASSAQAGGPGVDEQFLADLSALAQLRADRVLTGRSNLPGFLLFGLVAGGALTVAHSALLTMQKRVVQIVATAMLGAMIGLLLFMVVVLSQPYAGSTALGSGDYDYAVRVFQVVDAGG